MFDAARPKKWLPLDLIDEIERGIDNFNSFNNDVYGNSCANKKYS